MKTLYRDILAATIREIGGRLGLTPSPSELTALADSLPDWHLCPDTIPALETMRRHNRLAIISNIDDDVFAETAIRLGVPFDHFITAEQVRAYANLAAYLARGEAPPA